MTSSGVGRVTIERRPYDAGAWEEVVSVHPEAEPFHGAAWLAYLQAAFGAEPVVATVRLDGRAVGHVVGAIVRRYGVRILGSPLRGWGTQYLGFLLDPGVDRRLVADALVPFAFRDLGCLHVELGDPWLSIEAMAGSAYRLEPGITYVADLRPDESAILGAMRQTTRNYTRQALRKGLTVEVATDAAFADEYHAQLSEVFGRQGLAPTYPVERVRTLISTVGPSGDLLCLRVRDPAGKCIATGIFVGRNRRAVLWGAAFRREDADLHPNEAMHWEAMRHWRARGITLYDLGGGGDYKAKFGAVIVPTPRYVASRYAVLDAGRSAVRRLFRARQVVVGRRRSGHVP